MHILKFAQIILQLSQLFERTADIVNRIEFAKKFQQIAKFLAGFAQFMDIFRRRMAMDGSPFPERTSAGQYQFSATRDRIDRGPVGLDRRAIMRDLKAIESAAQRQLPPTARAAFMQELSRPDPSQADDCAVYAARTLLSKHARHLIPVAREAELLAPICSASR